MSNDNLIIAVQECMDSYETFSKHCLKVKAKSGDTVPFKMNKAQEYIHKRLEDQRRKTGKVRAIILKGRQMGCSTYIGGRYLWRTRFSRGLRCFILTHAHSATTNLFAMVKRYLENMPEIMSPKVGSDSATGLSFPTLDASYHVGTAGFKDTGVSETFQLFHASEAALWSNPEAIARGALQAVPDEVGTEVIIESTSRGASGWFYQQCQAALRGESEYIFIFCPWFWMPEYKKIVKQGFVKSQKEIELAQQFKLNDSQLSFRREKIIELGGAGGDGEQLFAMEYPNTVDEAFLTNRDGQLIPSYSVDRAMKSTLKQGYGKVVMGIDPASEGGDRAVIVVRQGRFIIDVLTKTYIKTTAFTGIIKRMIRKHRPYIVNVDKGTFGRMMIDDLHETGYSMVNGIDFGGNAIEKDKYFNRRTEIWCRLKLWLDDEPAMLPNRNDILMDLTETTYGYDMHGRIKLDSKSTFRKSTDLGDAFALTLAEEINTFDDEEFNMSFVPADSRVGI